HIAARPLRHSGLWPATRLAECAGARPAGGGTAGLWRGAFRMGALGDMAYRGRRARRNRGADDAQAGLSAWSMSLRRWRHDAGASVDVAKPCDGSLLPASLDARTPEPP